MSLNFSSSVEMSLDISEQEGRITCVKALVDWHAIIGYINVAIGALALSARVVSVLKPWHATFGRAFTSVMYVMPVTALWISTTGTPRAVMFFIVSLFFMMIVGVYAIRQHQNVMRHEALTRISAELSTSNAVKQLTSGADGAGMRMCASGSSLDATAGSVVVPLASTDLEKRIQEEIALIARQKSFRERFFSWKTLHGVCMMYSWYMLLGAGMVFTTRRGAGCTAQPMRKRPGGIVEPYPLADLNDPSSTDPAGFGALISVPMLLAFIAVGAGWAYWEARAVPTAQARSPQPAQQAAAH